MLTQASQLPDERMNEWYASVLRYAEKRYAIGEGDRFSQDVVASVDGVGCAVGACKKSTQLNKHLVGRWLWVRMYERKPQIAGALRCF